MELEDEADGWPMGMSTVSEIGKEDEGGGWMKTVLYTNDDRANGRK